MIATSAPSLANGTATDRPIPLSPPVITATFPASLLAAKYWCAFDSGCGLIFPSTPGCRHVPGKSGMHAGQWFASEGFETCKVEMIRDHLTSQPRGFAFIELREERQAH